MGFTETHQYLCDGNHKAFSFDAEIRAHNCHNAVLAMGFPFLSRGMLHEMVGVCKSNTLLNMRSGCIWCLLLCVEIRCYKGTLSRLVRNWML
jgi:hypothetical protein